MPGADDMLTAPETSKTTIFSKPKDLDTTFLEAKEAVKKEEEKEEDKKGELKPAELEAAKEVLSDLFDETDDTPKAAGRPKVDKSGLVDTFSKLIDEGLIVPFDDEKPLDEYSTKDWKELLQANFEERENKVKQEVPASFFDSLPDELKYAYKYISDGGQDLKGLFRALSHVEEVRQLDPADDNDQEFIARQYLRATQFGNEDEISEEIETWKDLGTLGKKASQFKPKLDKMQQEVVAYQLQQQEQFKQQQQDAAHQFMDNVYNTLKDGHLNGVRMDKKTQAFLFTELTQPKYQSLQGRNTNLLGHLLERYQFVEPRYDLIAETLWLLADPEGFKNNVRQQAKNEATQETVRKLKTEESKKISSTMTEEEESKPARRTIPRQQNIFKR
jgi:hypothetical protein